MERDMRQQTLNKNLNVPLYVQLKELILGDIQNGTLGGAVLDVTDPEPLPADHPLWDMPNVIITAHYAGWSVTGLERAQWFGENLKAYLKNEPLPGEVDRIWKY